jgi:hypothetical protein
MNKDPWSQKNLKNIIYTQTNTKIQYNQVLKSQEQTDF